MLELTEVIGVTKSIPRNEHLVLLVEPDTKEREEFGSWLEAAGYGVINCPGPPHTAMVCLGQRGQACGLVEISDLLVLDLRLVQDAATTRTPGRQLLHYYLAADKPVLLVGDPGQLGKARGDARLGVLRRRGRVSRRSFLNRIKRLEVSP